MCTHLAAANEYKISHLQSPPIWALVKQAQVFYVGGYHLTVSVPAIMALAEHAAAENKIFALGIGAPFIAQFFKDGLDQTSPYWDYFFCNETEAATWATGHGMEKEGKEEDINAIAKALSNLPKKNEKKKRVVVITQGEKKTVVAVQGEEKLREYPVKVIKKEDITDTNGAG